MEGFINFIELMQKGRTVNYIIMAIYIFVIYLAADRAVFFIRTAYSRKKFFQLLNPFTDPSSMPEKVSSAADIYGELLNGTCVRNISSVFLESLPLGRKSLEEAIDRTAAEELYYMNKGLVFLSRIAAVSPLLGLLGTVTGLMSAFQKISSLGGNVDIAMLSGGIWEAMITTATGLVTAVTAFVFYELFDWLSVKRSRDMEHAVSVLETYIDSQTYIEAKNEEVQVRT